MSRPFIILFLLYSVYGVSLGSECWNSSYPSQQLDLMLAEYPRETPPTPGALMLTLNVRHAAVDERASTVRMMGELVMRWTDTRLAWNVTDWGCDRALTSGERLWLPDLAASNAVSSGADAGTQARLYANGTLVWASPLDLTVPVSLDLADWPSDTQFATFKFVSRFTDGMKFKILQPRDYTITEIGAWEMQVLVGSVERGLRQAAAWELSLRRRAPAHRAATGCVLTAAALTLVAAALTPPAQRAPLCACAAFIAALWLISALPRLPGAASCPTALALMGALSVTGALASVFANAVLRLANRRDAPPQGIRDIVAAASDLCQLTPLEGSRAECSAWAAAAQLVDYVLLAALAIALLVIVIMYL